MPLKLLLVDDNATFVAAVRQFLDLLPGLEVVGHAYNGKEALVVTEASKPDVALLDIGMPGMNGLELARAMQLRADPPRIVFLSMQDNDAYRSAAQDIGASFVGKADFVAELLPMLELMVVAQDAKQARRAG